MKDLTNRSVSVVECAKETYPPPPFNPPAEYPEYPFKGSGVQAENHVYDAVRTMFRLLDLDSAHYGTPRWNPLGEIVSPGDRVVLKPNLVISEHELGLVGLEASTVHGSVIRPFVDYVWIALKGQGRITIGDSPIKEVDFDKITALMGVRAMVDFLTERSPDLPLEIVDYRDLRAWRREDGTIVATEPLDGDMRGYTVVDLGKESLFEEVAEHCGRFRSTASVYENVMAEVHTRESHKYSFANTVLESDVFISLAKMKTHRKAGVTLSLKNLVGLTNEKRWLPHHRVGTVSLGGDMLPDDAPVANKAAECLIEHFKASRYGRFGFTHILPALRKLYSHALHPLLSMVERKERLEWGEGDWHGNDTVWRMVLDLNQILLYADKRGVLHYTPQKRYFSCIDGIIAGEKEGPLHPVPKKTGLLVGGFNPVAVDLSCIKLMGYDYRKIPLLRGVDRLRRRLIFDENVQELWKKLEVASNNRRYTALVAPESRYHSFIPSAGWRGYIELD